MAALPVDFFVVFGFFFTSSAGVGFLPIYSNFPTSSCSSLQYFVDDKGKSKATGRTPLVIVFDQVEGMRSKEFHNFLRMLAVLACHQHFAFKLSVITKDLEHAVRDC
jgi:hypothetical protein